ncbi:hypothetical protein Tco_1361763 [Tanacetum coccineum]
MHQPPEESVKEFEEQPKTIVISALEGEFQPPQESSVEILQAKDDLMKSIQTFLKKFNQDIQDLLPKLLEDLKIISEELAEFINSPSWNRPTFYDDDDDEYTIIYRSTKAITHNLPTEEPEDSLIMGDEHLSTIPEKKSDEFIKSSVEDLVPIPSESEDTSDNESECDVLVCDDSNEDFTFSDDESLSEEDVPKETFKIYSNPLFEFDDDFTSSDVNPLFNEVLEDVESEDSFDSKLAELTLLISPLSDSNKYECFDPGGDEIDAFLDLDISTEIENDFHDSEGDIIFLSLKHYLLKHYPPILLPEYFSIIPKKLKGWNLILLIRIP